MPEQGLKAVVYPELDESAVSEFVKQFQEKIGGYVSLGVNIDTPTVTQSQSEAVEKKPETVNTSSDNEPKLEAKDIEDAVSNALSDDRKEEKKEKQKEDNGEPTKKDMTLGNILKEAVGGLMDTKTMSGLKTSLGLDDEGGGKLGSIVGKVGVIGTAVGVGATGVADIIQKVLKFLMDSSPALKEVFNIFSTLVSMIWQPIGTILAQELMPLIGDIAGDIGEWMNEAWEIYDREGWSGLIKKAVEMTFEVLGQMLGFVLPPLFEALWDIICGYLGDAWDGIAGWFGGLWDKFKAWLVDLILNLPTKIFETFESIFDMILGPLEGLPGIGDAITEVKNILAKIKDFIQDLWDKFIGGTIDAVTRFVDDPVGTISDAVSSSSDVLTGGIGGALIDGFSTIADTLGGLKFWADGGLITEPTLSVVGEAGPEAIIPLNQLDDFTKEYSSNGVNVSNKMDSLSNDYKINNQNISGGNTMTFNIYGNNSQEIGGEVQRILEKTVGKASSKMMWW